MRCRSLATRSTIAAIRRRSSHTVGAAPASTGATGAVEYTCAEGKRLFVRFTDSGNSAWVFLPDRELRLDRSGASDRYSNATTSLSLAGDSAQLDVEGLRQFADCKRKSS